MRFIPALVVTDDQVDEAAGIWADAVERRRQLIRGPLNRRANVPYRSIIRRDLNRYGTFAGICQTVLGCFWYSSCGGASGVPGISVPLIGQRVVSGTLISAIAPTTQAAIM